MLNSDDIYGKTYGAGYFYEQAAPIAAYDNRLKAILNYKGKYSGQVWKDWTSVIMAFDLENEPFSSKTAECQTGYASSWACGRAQTLRSTLGAESPIKIATGGFGGDISQGCTWAAGAASCPEIDIISVHRYAGPESSNEGQWANSYKSWISESNGKLVHLEEWGVNTNDYNPDTEFPANTEDMNKGGLPWSYWQLLPAQKCSSNDMDGFGFFINSGVPWQAQAQAASAATSPQNWNGVA